MSSSESETSSSSSSSSSDEEYRRRRHKKHQKHKDKKSKKKHKKKEKRHKEKKRQRRESSSDKVESKVIIPTAINALSTITDDADAFGPTLPPHLQSKKKTDVDAVPAAMIGPVMPTRFLTQSDEPAQSHINMEKESNSIADDTDDDMGTFGPLPTHNKASSMTAAEIELEERALALKLAAMDGAGIAGGSDHKVREEWMLELPDVGLKGGLAALNNLKRTFYQGKERPDFSDRSSWTKTPKSADATTSKTCNSKDLEKSAIALYAHKRDMEQETIAKKHKKKHKREESLVELHQKKLRKEQRKKEKELAASGEKPERRPFSRDVDLKLNKIDKNQTKQIVDKAKILNTKFASGHTKYL